MAYRNHMDYLPPLRAFRARFGRLETLEGGGGKGDAPPPPDYTPLAQASKEAAEIGAKLGREQLAENKRQYEQNMAVAKPIIDQQVKLADRTNAQGTDYFNYGKSFRPAEQAMLADSFGLDSASFKEANDLRRVAGQDARSKFESDRSQQMRDANARVNELKALQLAETKSANARPQAVGFYLTPDGRLVEPSATVARPTQLTNIRYGHGKKGLRNTQIMYDSVKKEADKIGGAVISDGDGGYVAVKPFSKAPNPSGSGSSDYSKLISEEQGRITQIADRQFNQDSVDYGDSDAFLSEQMVQAAAVKRAKDQALIDEQAGLDSVARQKIAGLMRASNAEIYQQNATDIESDVSRSVADARAGYSNSINQAMRQGLRYGFSPAKLAAMAGSASAANASQQAAAANQTRNLGLTDARNRLIGAEQTGMQLRQNDFGRSRGYTIQDDAKDWAKRMDVVGMARGMPGASQGAYGLSNAAGNSAVANQNSTSAQFMNGMNAGNGLVMQGKGMEMQGLGQVLSAQNSYGQQQAQIAAGKSAGIGSAVGAGLGLAATLYSGGAAAPLWTKGMGAGV